MTEKHTDISSINFINSKLDTETDIELDEDNLPQYIFDFSFGHSVMMHALETHHKLYNDDTVEIVSRLTGMYQFSGVKFLREFLFKICTESNLSSFLKLEAAMSLLSVFEDEDDDVDGEIVLRNKKRMSQAYKALDIVCKDIKNLPTPCRIEAVCSLMKSDKYKTNCNNYFQNIIVDQTIECDFRYRTILSLEKRDIKNKEFYLKSTLIEFMYHNTNRIMYRILAAQYLLQNIKMSRQLKKEVEEQLLKFALDSELDYNLRADAADVLLNMGSRQHKKQAREIIILLGGNTRYANSIFDNAQNVHVEEIESSVIDIIETLATLPLLSYKSSKKDKRPITYNYVKKQIEDIMKSETCEKMTCISSKTDESSDDLSMYCNNECQERHNRHNSIRISLNRIYVDRALYSRYNFTLRHLLLKVWSFIASHEYNDTLKQRLLEELVDMSGTCSTGFASRLINVLSGFGDFSFRISWVDQIIANFKGRLNAYARNIDTPHSIFFSEPELNYVAEIYIRNNQTSISGSTVNEIANKFLRCNADNPNKVIQYFKEAVLNEMIVCPSRFEERQSFLLFFRTYISSIRQEMYEEFKDYISDTDFDLYIRHAISNYEMGI
jgi:hypothetical protein